jgi:hypothetical protein
MNRLLQFFKDKAKVNLTINLIMFILLMAMAGIGFLIKYILLPGVQRNLKYGNDINLEYLGMDRHQWGSIHLIISIIFLILMIIHILLHWKMIVSIFRRMIPGSYWQVAIAGSIAVISLLLISFSLFVKPEQVPHEPLYRGREQQTGFSSRGNHFSMEHQTFPGQMKEDIPENKPAGEHKLSGEEATKSELSSGEATKHELYDAAVLHEHDEDYSEFEVSGNQTLQYVSNRYNVPAAVICRDLNIPEHLAGERLGKLKKMYLFTMTDVRKSIVTYKRQNVQ